VQSFVLHFPLKNHELKKQRNNMEKQKRIVIIEDDKGIIDAVQMALEFEGYDVTTADRGDYADDLIDGRAPLPDLIMLDMLLSGKDGRTICKDLKKNPKTKRTPVIMMSAHPRAESSSKEAGADGFLPKPFPIKDLLTAVQKLI
jgi:DNA-binding response OmpR family regulator